MKTSYGHLSYCTNIHSGETWEEHFSELKMAVPLIKKQVSPALPFGIGLRLSDIAGTALVKPENINEFKNWLSRNNCYVFTINGFPFGNFHQNPVKSNVYAPDWTMTDRLKYTLKLFDILKELLPDNTEGSISTSPLSYRHWFKNEKMLLRAYEKCTLNILEVVAHLINIYNDSGKLLHLNIEPEPDGLIENATEFIEWYNNYYIPLGVKFLEKKFTTEDDKTQLLKRHLRLCHDICHSAVAYENIEDVLKKLKKNNILIGKVQLSSALKISLISNRHEKIERLRKFNEPIYLHQVVMRDNENRLYKFRDITDALDHLADERFKECRVHFHIPLFLEKYDLLSSTQDNIISTLLDNQHICNHWEVETYTWNILPKNFRLPLNESITRELEWVLDKMNTTRNE